MINVNTGKWGHTRTNREQDRHRERERARARAIARAREMSTFLPNRAQNPTAPLPPGCKAACLCAQLASAAQLCCRFQCFRLGAIELFRPLGPKAWQRSIDCCHGGLWTPGRTGTRHCSWCTPSSRYILQLRKRGFQRFRGHCTRFGASGFGVSVWDYGASLCWFRASACLGPRALDLRAWGSTCSAEGWNLPLRL